MALRKEEEVDPLLVRALRGEKVERVPVWAMRQAGRWDPEFRRYRGERSFYEFSENPELSAAASLCPKRFGVDAIILFYDITTLAVSMGQEFELVPGRGPVPMRPIESMEDLSRLAADPEPARYQHVIETLRLVARELEGELPILVFAGAPFTLASYQLGIGRDIERMRTFIAEQPKTWHRLLERTTTATISFLRQLLESGASAYQLFDSWAGGLTEAEYAEYCQPFHQRVFHEVGGLSILFVKELPFLELGVASGATAISLGTRHSLADCRKRFPETIFQGNVDHQLLVDGSPDDVARATRACLKEGGGHHHVLNLDHGMDPNAQPENFAAFVETAKRP